MKSVILNVRIPIALKEQLENNASDNNLSLSDYTREILLGHNTEEDDSIQDNFSHISEANLYNSSEFIYLLTWMLDKRSVPYDTNQTAVFEGLKTIVLKVIKSNCFPDELKQEFAKLLVDLSRFINEYGSVANNYFRFCLNNYPESFNYYLLIKFIYDKTFENRIYL